MILALVLYLTLQLGVCLLISRWIKSESDYLLAGRTLPLIPASLSVFATWFGAEIMMGSSGAIAKEGLSGGRADPFGYSLCLVLMGLLLAGVLRKRAYVTVGDFFADHYDRRVEVVASLIMMATSVIWAAAQIQAFAFILTALLPVSEGSALLIAVVGIILYTTFGGMLGDVVNDVIQGGLMITGLGILLVMMILKAGGPTVAFNHLSPAHWSVISPKESIWLQINTWAIPILGSLVAPEALSRTLSAKDERVAVNACYWGGGLYFLVGSMVALVALIGTRFVSGISDADMYLPQLVQTILPPWVGVIFLGALVSAILSTIDSTLLSIGGLAAHNVILPNLKRWLHHDVVESKKVLVTRLVVIVSGLLSYGIALGDHSIYTLVQSASSFGSAGFLICVLGGLYWPGVRAGGALVILAAGVMMTLLFEYVWHWELAYLLNLLGCTLLYSLFWLWETKAKPATVTVEPTSV